MAEKQYYIERGNERKFVPESELAKHSAQGWVVLGVSIPLDEATARQLKANAKAPRPQSGGRGEPGKNAGGEDQPVG
jgi:hypothetical protein